MHPAGRVDGLLLLTEGESALSAKPRVLVLHGPNLNLLGEREPEVYGRFTLRQINARIREAARKSGCLVEIAQSNHEGELIDRLHRARRRVVGIVINPGALAHTSLALADAIRATALPAVEVHLSNIFAREEIRRRLLVAPACRAIISGLGWRGYVVALHELLSLIHHSRRDPSA